MILRKDLNQQKMKANVNFVALNFIVLNGICNQVTYVTTVQSSHSKEI